MASWCCDELDRRQARHAGERGARARGRGVRDRPHAQPPGLPRPRRPGARAERAARCALDAAGDRASRAACGAQPSAATRHASGRAVRGTARAQPQARVVPLQRRAMRRAARATRPAWSTDVHSRPLAVLAALSAARARPARHQQRRRHHQPGAARVRLPHARLRSRAAARRAHRGAHGARRRAHPRRSTASSARWTRTIC